MNLDRASARCAQLGSKNVTRSSLFCLPLTYHTLPKDRGASPYHRMTANCRTPSPTPNTPKPCTALDSCRFIQKTRETSLLSIWCLRPLPSDGPMVVLCLPKSSVTEASSWENLSSRKPGDNIDSLMPDTSCVPQVLSLRDFGARNTEASGLSGWLLLSYGHPESHPAPMSWGNLPRVAWSTKHPGLQTLPCRPILH